MASPKLRVLFVCMGNLCRSPTAEGVLRAKLRAAGLDALVEVDSAGTHGWHDGSPPDARSQAQALRRGYDLSALRARRIGEADFERFDLVLVMDDENLENVHAVCPPERRERVARLMSHARRHQDDAVPDPYYGNVEGFDRVLDMIEDACDGLVAHLAARLGR